MINERCLYGLSLKTGPLGENDRLLTLLSDQEGLTRIAVPNARKANSRFTAAIPLNLLELNVVTRKSLARVKHLKVITSFNQLGQRIETLAAAQALAEICLMLVAENDPLPGILSTIVIHLKRLKETSNNEKLFRESVLAKTVQASVHLLALGGYGLPVQACSRSQSNLEPPLGKWEWRCSFIPNEGFVIGDLEDAPIHLNPSELALLQRLFRPDLPMRSNGELMGPLDVWLKLLSIVECWIRSNLQREVQSLSILKATIEG